MRPFVLGFILLYLIAIAYQEPIEKLENILVYPVEPATRRTRRDTEDKRKNDCNRFVEDKLVQHTQALEHLVKLIHSNEETSRQIVEALSQKVVEPKAPQKIEVHHGNRRSGDIDDGNPIVRFVKNIPKYGEMLRNIVMAEFKRGEEPVVIEDHLSRRSLGSRPVFMPNSQRNNRISPWCSVAILCHRTVQPVCGYDDNFGYGRFDDVCHMLQVNCYWKYNFALVPSCKPVFK